MNLSRPAQRPRRRARRQPHRPADCHRPRGPLPRSPGRRPRPTGRRPRYPAQGSPAGQARPRTAGRRTGGHGRAAPRFHRRARRPRRAAFGHHPRQRLDHARRTCRPVRLRPRRPARHADPDRVRGASPGTRDPRVGLLTGTDAVIVGANPPGQVGGVALRQEHGQWVVTLTGIHGIQPPTDLEEFIKFAAALPTTALTHVASTATPIGDPEVFRYPASRWRHYERLARRPEGFLVIGDAVCSFNPVYGQGMSSAGRQVLALADLLASVSDSEGLARAAADAAGLLAKVVATPWSLATGADRRFPGMPAKPLPERVLDRYMDRLVKVAARLPSDPCRHAGAQPARAASTLLAPAMAARVLRRGATRNPPASAQTHPSPVTNIGRGLVKPSM